MILEYDDVRDSINVRNSYCEIVENVLSNMTGAEHTTVLHQAVSAVISDSRRTKVNIEGASRCVVVIRVSLHARDQERKLTCTRSSLWSA